MPKIIATTALVLIMISLSLLGTRSTAQTARQAAVAIDAVPIATEEAVELERIATGLHSPWSFAFTPGGEILITEKYVGVRVFRNGRLDDATLPGGPPNVLAKEDSGLLDIVLDPDFARNRLVYIAFAEGTEAANHTSIWKARYDGHRLTGGHVVFRSHPDKDDTSHPGGRMLFLSDKTLLLTIGDGFKFKTAAQDLMSDLGKIVRLTRDGAPAPGNPFIGRGDARPEVWSFGHRNPQGLTRDTETGLIWEHEHGPRGGDEINLLKPGLNYGWPVLTHGIDYDGKIISDRTFAPGMEPSIFYWAPSIAPSGLVVYRGDAFPDWKGKVFVGALAARTIVRLRRGKDTSLLAEDARMFMPLKKRIRDIREGPDGLLYVLTDEDPGDLIPHPAKGELGRNYPAIFCPST